MRSESVVTRTRICLPMPAAHDDSGGDGASGMASGTAPTRVIFIACRPCYRSPRPYSCQRSRTRASSSGAGRTVGGKRSLSHSGRLAIRHERVASGQAAGRSEEHTSELQSQSNLVCRLLLEKKKKDAILYPYRVLR